MSEMNNTDNRQQQYANIVSNFLNASRGSGMLVNYNGNPIKRLSEFAMLLYLIKNGKLQIVANIQSDGDDVLAIHSGMGIMLSGMRKEWNWRDIVHIAIVKSGATISELDKVMHSLQQSLRRESNPEYLIITCELIKEAQLTSKEYTDLLLYAETTLIAKSGRLGFEFANPQSLAKLVTSLIDKNTKVVFDPFMGVGSFATYLPNDIKFIGSDIVSDIVNYVSIKLSLIGVNYSCVCNNSMKEFSPIAGTTIVSFPPIQSSKDNTSISNLINYFIEGDCNEMILITTQNVCYAEGYKSLRKLLVKNNYLETVIHLNEGYLYGTGISSIIIHLKKKRDNADSILMVSSEKYKIINDKNIDIDVDKLSSDIHQKMDIFDKQINTPLEKVVENDYRLTPQFYLLSPENHIPDGYRFVFLRDIVSIISTKHYTQENIPIVRISNLATNPLQTGFPKNMEEGTSQQQYVCVNEEAVLLSKIRYLKPTHYIPDCSVSIYLHPNVVALKVCTNDVTYDYLCNELSKDYVKKQYESFFTGIGVPSISTNNILNIKILIPSITVQNDIVKQAYKDNMSESEIELHRVYEQYQQEIHTRKHAMGQTLSAMSARFNSLMRYIKRKDGKINMDDIFGQPYQTSVKEILQSIYNDIETLNIRVSNLTDIVTDWGKIEPIELDSYLQKYIASHHSDIFRIEYQPKDSVLAGITQKDGEPYIYEAEPIREILIPYRALSSVLDNIISNACSHGFIDASKKDYVVKFDFDYQDTQVILEVSNNGASVKDGVDIEKIFDYAYTTSLNEIDKFSNNHKVHSGIGGYEIKRILAKYNADVEFISSPENETTVTYRITFNNVKIPESEWTDNE